MSGDHVTSGAIIAEEMCDRLGLTEEEKRRVVFLVYNHLALAGLAFGRELEDHVIEEFTRHVGNRETLDMLYILTILDIRHVGFRTWTAWRAHLLETAYDRAVLFLSRKNTAESDLRSEIGIGSALYMLDTLPKTGPSTGSGSSGFKRANSKLRSIGSSGSNA